MSTKRLELCDTHQDVPFALDWLLLVGFRKGVTLHNIVV